MLPIAAENVIEGKVQVVAIIATVLLFGVVLELVRRRRLVERYALLWMVAAVALLVLALWRDLLTEGANLVGVESPPNALFLVAIGVIVAILLNFSIAISRLSEETKILAQESARLDAELRAVRGEVPGANGNGADADGGDGAAQGEPSSATTTDQ